MGLPEPVNPASKDCKGGLPPGPTCPGTTPRGPPVIALNPEAPPEGASPAEPGTGCSIPGAAASAEGGGA